jgi:flagellar biosynthesis protein FlhF
MRLKTFRASTITEALQEIKREFGQEAIILSTLEKENEVSITAALERKDEFNLHNLAANEPLDLLNEFCLILEHHRVPDVTRERLIMSLSSSQEAITGKRFEDILEKIFSFKPIINSKGKFLPPARLALLGPSGAGKSVTIAKLASEYVIAGFEPFVITLDCLKAGAITQLEVYMKAIGLPLHAAENIKQFKKVLNESPVNTYILVDTPGVNPYRKDEIQFLKEVIDCLNGEAIFTFPAGIDPWEIRDYLGLYKNLGVRRVIFTRADTTYRYGALMTSLYEGGFSLAQVSAGPELGSRLKGGDSKLLAELLMQFRGTNMQTYFALEEATKEQRR